MESDFLGSIYEKLIPPEERKKLGQFYTPPQIADLIIALTIKNKDSTILDPACGSGTFLVEAYQRLRELGGISKGMTGGLGETYHKQILEQIYGIDINQFPAHLSVINLAIQNPRAKIDKVNVIVSDFFNIKPKQSTLFGFRSMDTSGQETEVYALPSFDTVIANPPYIRQELLGKEEKERIKNTIETDYTKLSVGTNAKKTSNVVLDKQSDIYIYFFIHALSMLNDNGMLGFIASNKWLEVGYGEPFQEFLLTNCRIKYIIEFDRAIFPDAEVNTAIVILQKARILDPSYATKFVRFKRKIPLSDMVDIIEKGEDSTENKDYRLNILRQNDLKIGKWNIHLRAPPVFQKIVKHSKVKRLGEIAKPVYGIKTGYNKYFIIDKERAKDFKIEKKFLKPCLSSPRKEV
ncbi:MAG: N-6 DNA methylase [Nitrososphaera sp.]|jgi:type I restriction-modification system DNA methylase subunit